MLFINLSQIACVFLHQNLVYKVDLSLFCFCCWILGAEHVSDTQQALSKHLFN